MKHINRRKMWLALAISTLIMPGPALAGTVAGTGGATEFTQLANNIQLVQSTVNQAKQIAEAITTRIASVQQAIAAVKNLKQLPLRLDPSLTAFQGQLSALTQAYSSVMALGKSAAGVQAMITSRINEAGAMGIDLKTYLASEIKLAGQRGGVYQKRVASDIGAIQDMATKSANLGAVIDQNKDVIGNIQGLQQLAQISSISAGELLEVKSLLLAQQLDRDVAGQDKSTDDRAFSAAVNDAAGQAKAREQRNGQLQIDVRNPWAAP